MLAGISLSQKLSAQNGKKNAEVAIHNTISDFAKSCYLFKKDSVFHVSVENTFRRLTLQINGSSAKWVCDSIYSNILVVQISGETNKIPYFSDAAVGSKGKLPSRYAIIKGRLFYWDDNDYPLTEETLFVLKEYNLLSNVIDVNNITFPDFTIDDSKKGADYFYCSNNLSKYLKRIITNIGLGYYKPPKLKCNK